MATFLYEALREPGQIIKGEIDAEDQKAAVSGLVHRGYHVVRIEDAARGGRLRLRYGLFGLKRRELTRFTRRLAVLLQSGLPLVQALARMRKHGAEGQWRSVAAGLQARLEDGQTLSEALHAYPQLFDAMYVHLVRAGEAGGTLAETLLRLADTGERRDELRARTRMALATRSKTKTALTRRIARAHAHGPRLPQRHDAHGRSDDCHLAYFCRTHVLGRVPRHRTNLAVADEDPGDA